MKKVILSFATALLMANANTAQVSTPAPDNIVKNREHKNKSPEERSIKDAERATEKLTLSAEQKVKWQKASLERINANDPLKLKMNATKEKSEKRQIASDLRGNQLKFEENVNGFLTADQKIKWEQLKKKKKDLKKAKRDIPNNLSE